MVYAIQQEASNDTTLREHKFINTLHFIWSIQAFIRSSRYYHRYDDTAPSSTDSFGFGLRLHPLHRVRNQSHLPLILYTLTRACIRSMAAHLCLTDLLIGGRSVICYATSTILQYIKLPSNKKSVEIDVMGNGGAPKQLAVHAEQRAT